MNEYVETSDLETAARQVLRYRLPLALAVLTNLALLVRVPLLQMWADDPSAAASTTAIADAGHGRLTAPPMPRATHRTVQLFAPDTPEPTPPDAPADPPVADAPHPPPLAPSDGLAASDWQASILRQCLAHCGPHSAAPGPDHRSDVALPPPTPAPTAAPTAAPAPEPALPPVPQALILRNARQNGGPVRFVVNDRVYELLPGESHEFTTESSWDVQFHRGESFGNARRQLACGVYSFVVTERGWDLQAVAP